MMNNDNKKGALLAPLSCSSMLKHGIKRITEKSPQRVDVIYGCLPGDDRLNVYDWVVVLEAMTRAVGETLEDDTWSVTVDGAGPKIVRIKAKTERARLFAMYHIAKCLEMGKEPAEWAIERRPRLARRYAWISGGNCWSSIDRPDWFNRDIEDIPGLGLNGVLLNLTPAHGTAIGAQTLPLSLTEDGVKVDRFLLPAFLQMLERIKSYGMDIGILHQPFIPPEYTVEAVRDHYNGKTFLPDLDKAIEATSHDLAAAVFEHMPQVDCLLFHSLECDWMWGKAVSMFPCKDDETSGKALEAYLKGQLMACETYGKTLMFWTHVSGISARQLRLMHEILERYPDVMVIEDHKWPNNTWPHAPVMGYLVEDIRDTVTARRWGMSITSTDGETYGAGSCPSAYPDPNVLSAETAVQHGAECVYIRFNEQNMTPLRTLDDVNAIQLITCSEVMWQDPRPSDVLWKEWCIRRFGAAAAPALVSAIRKSADFVMKAMTVGNQPTIDTWFRGTFGWKPGRTCRAWDLFARPGERLVEKPWDELVCEEMRPWQCDAYGTALDDYLRNNAEAEAAMREALQEIESVRADLAEADYAYLSTCFANAVLVIKAMRVTAIAARASALYMAEKTAEHRQRLETACADMKACADYIEAEHKTMYPDGYQTMRQGIKGHFEAYGPPIGLRKIAEMYLDLIES